MKEIGGYLELDRYTGSIFHVGAVALNCGRAALRYLIRTKKIRKMYLPYFCCDAVADACQRENIKFEYYHIDASFRPVFDKVLSTDEWLYIVNFYGQVGNDELETWQKKFGRVIFDNVQAYFQKPVDGIDTLYTCRKFLGVADGAFLYTQDKLDELERDESFDRMCFVLGRFERTASEFYKESEDNNNFFTDEPVKLMSKLTENLLRAIDYPAVEKQRTENFTYLHEKLKEKNRLYLTIPTGAYMYPFYCETGAVVRKALQAQKIYIPTLWPDVFDICDPVTLEYDYAMNILPLPVDQRYGIEDMKYIINLLQESMEKNNDQ
ncbi:MAG: hypothetical protein XD75_0265 [Parcubacteria bacterium 33_209]|nr:MAG: hypothetical protein XD75_0265 [Parcubacteria bacterium 33_209]